MDWSNILNYIYIGIAAISVILSVVSFIFKSSKTGSIIKNAKDTIDELSEKNKSLEEKFEIIKDYIPEVIEQAEETGMTGLAKKIFAMSQLIIKCSSVGLDFESLKDMFSEQIEKIVALTKSVNKDNINLQENERNEGERQVNEQISRTEEANNSDDEARNGTIIY